MFNLFGLGSVYIMMTSSNGNIFRVTGPLSLNSCEDGDLRRHRAHYNVGVMMCIGVSELH